MIFLSSSAMIFKHSFVGALFNLLAFFLDILASAPINYLGYEANLLIITLF
jgi:hypothetical protein